MLGSLLYYSQQARHQRSRFLANLLWFDDYGHDQYNLTARAESRGVAGC